MDRVSGARGGLGCREASGGRGVVGKDGRGNGGLERAKYFRV